jgi:hypothetical protein
MKSNLLKTNGITVSAIALVMAVNIQAQNTLSLTVTSNPLWTDTGITVAADETVNITATGLWIWGGGIPFTDAGGQDLVGTQWSGFVTDEFVQNGYQGMLIGFMGTSPGSFGNYASGPFFAIGDASTFTTPASGDLWLGFNDDEYSNAVDDNVGTQLVTLTGDFTTSEVPEPSIAMLLINGILAAVCFMRRKMA